MTAKPWIVHHREGWCALPPGAVPDPDALNDPTLCGYVVNMRGGSKRGKPDCPECLALLDASPEAAGTEHDDQPPAQPPGTGDVVATSPSLGAPWDYGPGTDLGGVQFTPRFRWPAKPRRRGV